VRQKSHKMEKIESFWVLGHKVTNYKTTGDYDLAVGETPGNTPGPPPHKHDTLAETFLITEGEMEFMRNGEIIVARAGDLIDLPPKTVHTFSNKTDKPCKWVNVHSPKGFRGFFEFVGVPVENQNARIESVSESLIQTVIKKAADFDMHIVL